MKLVLITIATALFPFALGPSAFNRLSEKIAITSNTLVLIAIATATSAFALRSSFFGLLSALGLRPSAFPRA